MSEEERIENGGDGEAGDGGRGIDLADHSVVLIVVLAIALVGNFLGPDLPLLGPFHDSWSLWRAYLLYGSSMSPPSAYTSPRGWL